MDKVFIYWDNSNIVLEAKRLAAKREGQDVRPRVRIHFDNLISLARAKRQIKSASVAGLAPPELDALKGKMEKQDIKVRLFKRENGHGEPTGPDESLQRQMLRDAHDHQNDPGIAVLLTGDGKGLAEGVGFHADARRMHKQGWRVEILSWKHSCTKEMRQWAEDVGAFISLDDYYESITYLEPSTSGFPTVESRPSKDLDLSRRSVAK